MTTSIKMDNVRLEHADNRSQGVAGQAEPGRQAKDAFERALSERDNRGQEQGSKDGEDGQNSQAMPSASSLFGSLFENRMGGVESAASVAPAADDLGELVDDLVQRILVSEPKSGEAAEVRLQINDSILRGTEIMLQRGPDGLLLVQMVTDNASAMQTLVSAQQALKEQLEKHGPVNVRVESREESQQGDNDSNRRSQGLIDYGPEQV